MVYYIFGKKTGSGGSINEELAEELHKTVIKKFKPKKYMRELKAIFWQQNWLKWDYCLLRTKK